MNPALAVGIDPVNGGVLGRTVEIWGAQKNFPTGYAYMYSWSFDYSLPWKVVASAGFQGSTDHHLIRIVNQNFLYPNSANAEFGPIYFPQPDVNSNYNALNLGLTRSFANGFGLQAKYRWAKSMDEPIGGRARRQHQPDLSAGSCTASGDLQTSTPRTLRCISGQYELPWYKKQQGFVGKMLGGFSLSGISTYHTGFPYTVKIGQSVSTPGGPSQGPIRPTKYYGNAVYSTSNDAFLNGTNWPGGGAKYFDIADTGYPGIGRNSFRGPHYFGTDLSVIKQTRLPETWHMGSAAMIDVRANLYNVFNQLNLTPLNYFDSGVFADSGQFGRATQPALAGRVVEFQARFTF